MKNNKKLLKQYDSKVENCFIGQGHYDLTATAFIYQVQHRFLWWKWNTIETKYSIPYISAPYYDGEYSTNRKLAVAAHMLEAKCESFIATMEG